jgi:hypothetical protein
MRRLVAISLVAVITGCGSGGDDPAPTPVGTTSSSVGDLAVYEVEDAGFALGVPRDWRAVSVTDFQKSENMDAFAEENPAVKPALDAIRQPDSPIKLVAFAPPEKGFSTNVNVTIEILPEGVSLTTYADAGVAQVERMLPDVNVSRGSVDLRAGTATRLEYDAEFAASGRRLEVTYVQYVFVQDRKAYVITYASPDADSAERYRDDIESSIRSFRFL